MGRPAVVVTATTRIAWAGAARPCSYTLSLPSAEPPPLNLGAPEVYANLAGRVLLAQVKDAAGA